MSGDKRALLKQWLESGKAQLQPLTFPQRELWETSPVPVADMEIRGGSKTNLQLLIKQRRSKGSSEVVYQVLWPKERKGEAVLLRKSANGPTSGIHLTANGAQPIDPSDALFDGDLAYEDAVDNFFAWDQQAVVGTEAVDGVECQIL